MEKGARAFSGAGSPNSNKNEKVLQETGF